MIEIQQVVDVLLHNDFKIVYSSVNATRITYVPHYFKHKLDGASSPHLGLCICVFNTTIMIYFNCYQYKNYSNLASLFDDIADKESLRLEIPKELLS